eukprot:403366906
MDLYLQSLQPSSFLSAITIPNIQQLIVSSGDNEGYRYFAMIYNIVTLIIYASVFGLNPFTTANVSIMDPRFAMSVVNKVLKYKPKMLDNKLLSSPIVQDIDIKQIVAFYLVIFLVINVAVGTLFSLAIQVYDLYILFQSSSTFILDGSLKSKIGNYETFMAILNFKTISFIVSFVLLLLLGQFTTVSQYPNSLGGLIFLVVTLSGIEYVTQNLPVKLTSNYLNGLV